MDRINPLAWKGWLRLNLHDLSYSNYDPHLTVVFGSSTLVSRTASLGFSLQGPTAHKEILARNLVFRTFQHPTWLTQH